VQNAGSQGINANGVIDNAKSIGVHLDRGSVSSLLSRLKREGVLSMVDGRYFVPTPSPSQIFTH
jgi:predicted transcriptional regulator of viral defense system